MAKLSIRYRRLRGLLSAGIVATALVVGSPGMAAAQINFVGVTTYKFDAQSFGATRTLGGLAITQNGFGVTTNSFGYAAIGGQHNSLGLVSLAAIPFNYNSHTFQMLVAFSSPTAASQTFLANVTGAVSSFNGGARITFSPSQISGIPFTSGTGSGTFDLYVNNVSITPGQTGVQLTGDITATVTSTPEPASMVLVATGFAGIFGVAHRRKRKV